jgi:uncharacterized membrane protein YgaE (UPF0421/DUF939 family)
MKSILVFVGVVIGFYGLLTWAADNPRSVRKIHKKVDATVASTVDKGERVVGELSK